MSPDSNDPPSEPSLGDSFEPAARPADRQPPQKSGAAHRLKSSLENELAALEQELERSSSGDSPAPAAPPPAREPAAAEPPVESAASPAAPPARHEIDLDLPIDPPAEPVRPSPPPARGSAPDAAPEPAGDGTDSPKGGRRSLSIVELGGLAAMALILAGGIYFLLASPSGTGSRAAGGAPDRGPSPSRGELVRLAEIESYWRDRSDTDRVDATQNILPEVRVKVDPSDPSGEIFLKIHFLDPDRSIAGDVRSIRIAGGKLVPTSRGEEIIDATSFKVAASRGFPDRTAFLTYRFGEDPRWAVEIFEGRDYATGPWKRIAYFEVPTDYREESAPESGQ